MRIPRLRRRWVVLALVAAVLFVGYRQLDAATHIYYYRVVDPHTLLVGTVSGPGASVRVTDVTENRPTITITVTSFFFQLGPSTAEGYSYESVAKLIDPIGGRTVVDGSSGQAVQRATCPPPGCFAPVCP